MQHYFTPDGALSALAEGLERMAKDDAVQSVLVLSCDANAYANEALSRLLQAQTKPLIGGLFPQIVFQYQAYEQGVLLVGLPYALQSFCIGGLSESNRCFADEIEAALADQPTPPTVLVWVDGLAKCISDLVDGLFDVLGAEPHYIGGGAGSLSFVQKPCLFSNQGVHQDSALIGLLQAPSRIAVGHGWTSVDRDHQITRAEKNTIYEIDHRNAFEVYASVVNRVAAQTLVKDNFFQIAQAFPFGINKLSDEKVVRDPIAVTDEGALVCVGELVEGDFVDILSAKPAQLVAAAAETASRAYAQVGAAPPQMTLLIDCISRALFLRPQFHLELEAIWQVTPRQTPLFGALVLGEIANSGAGYLEFYNKTTVVASI
jgi:hypothetical protein